MFDTRFDRGVAESATGLGDLVSKRIAPISDWTDMGRNEHFVQFYDSDEFIVNSAAEYLIHGLKTGEICIVAATAGHLDMIAAQMDTFGASLDRARLDGRYIALDAVETLASFMINGSPDAGLFTKLIGGLISDAAKRGGEIRIFGEMVGVLCAEGNFDAAIQLEELWNVLGRDHKFSLFCAYSMSTLQHSAAGARMMHICSSHSRVIPDESYTSLTSADERLRMIAGLQQKGRQLEAELAELEQRIATRQDMQLAH